MCLNVTIKRYVKNPKKMSRKSLMNFFHGMSEAQYEYWGILKLYCLGGLCKIMIGTYEFIMQLLKHNYLMTSLCFPLLQSKGEQEILGNCNDHILQTINT